MNSKILVLAALILVIMPELFSCSKTIVLTQTEILTIAGQNTTQTITGQNVTQTTTVAGPTGTITQTSISTILLTTPGPTTTLIHTTTAVPAGQGFTYVSSISPASPATLHFGDRVTITFDYVITDTTGVYVQALPFSKGKGISPIDYQGSQIVPAGKGTMSSWFTIPSGAVTVDQICLRLRSVSSGTTFIEAYVPVSYSFIP